MPLRILESNPAERLRLRTFFSERGLVVTETKASKFNLGDDDQVVLEVIAGKQTTAADVDTAAEELALSS